ncbi:hypothetical protein D3C80_2137720 [compost metagenome]
MVSTVIATLLRSTVTLFEMVTLLPDTSVPVTLIFNAPAGQFATSAAGTAADHAPFAPTVA